MLQKLDLRQRIGTQLVTSLLTSPITYVPHYHFAMVDELLRDLSVPSETGHRLMALTGINILEFDVLRGVIRDFETKDFHEYYTDYQDLGRWMEYLAFPGKQPPTLGADKPVVSRNRNLYSASLTMIASPLYPLLLHSTILVTLYSLTTGNKPLTIWYNPMN